MGLWLGGAAPHGHGSHTAGGPLAHTAHALKTQRPPRSHAARPVRSHRAQGGAAQPGHAAVSALTLTTLRLRAARSRVGRDGRRARGAEGWRAGGAVLAWKREVLAHMQGIWVKYSPRAHTELRAAAPREDGAARWRRRPSVRVGGRFRAVGKHVAAGGCEFTAKSA